LDDSSQSTSYAHASTALTLEGNAYLDDPSNASGLGASKVDASEAVLVGCTGTDCLFVCVRVDQHSKITVDVVLGVLLRDETAEDLPGFVEPVFPDKPPWRLTIAVNDKTRRQS
jgi:hypothetical protein